MKVFPLSFSKANWDSFIEVCQDVLSYSPTRGIDEAGININSAPALLAALDLQNQPVRNLEHGVLTNTSFKHFFCSFIAIIDADLLLELYTYNGLSIMQAQKGKRVIVILSGTMDIWYHAIIKYNSTTVSTECRELFNEILAYFDVGGFTRVWSKKNRRELTDGTFAIV